MLKDGKHRLVRLKYLALIPLAVFVITAVFSLVRSQNPGQILMIWIEGSFYLYMFYFFLMMIPSVGSDPKIKIFDKKIPGLCAGVSQTREYSADRAEKPADDP